MNDQLLRKILVLLVAAGIFAAPSGAKPPEPPQVLKTDKLQEPPMQEAAWTPPKCDVPADVVAATEMLFKQGLADPRGCEYRSMKVGTGDRYIGDRGVIECHGWLIPASEKDARRFAVCWNGLIYQVVTFGNKADLAADVKAIASLDQKDRYLNPFPGEAESVSEKTLSAVKVCLLLRLGEAAGAMDFWNVWRGLRGGHADHAVPHTEFSDALKWSLFNRAVCAHQHGDDELSLLSAEAVMRLKNAVETDPAWPKPAAKDQPSRDFLEVVPALIQDEKRRIKSPPPIGALKKGERSFGSRAAWVAALISDLDQAKGSHGGELRGPGQDGDPIIRALINCGDDAVEPLIDCVESDTRLTRSVWSEDNYPPPYRYVGKASDEAFWALTEILHTSYIAPTSSDNDEFHQPVSNRKDIASKIRAFWKKYKGVPLDERWFRILADDNASYDQWLQAMSDIATPIDVVTSPGTVFGSGSFTVPRRKPGEIPRKKGEALLKKHDPSLADLVGKRVSQINADRAASAAAMAIALCEMDPAKGQPVVRKELKYCVALFADRFTSHYGEPLQPKIAGMAAVLAKDGDFSGLKIYGDWLRMNVSPSKIGADPEEVLMPLWTFQDDPAMGDTAEKMFNGQSSDWNPMLPHVNRGWGQQDLLRSPLLGLKSFREQVLRGLVDQTQYGTVTIGANHGMTTQEENSNGSMQIASGETHIAPVGTTTPLRVCDNYANQISQMSGAPEVEFYWPQSDRDAAVKACSEFLKKYADRLRYNKQFIFDDSFPMTQACHLTFPLLDHCASQKEATSLQAIFSLENQGERRQLKLSDLPTKAKWVTLNKYPQDHQYFDGVKGESRTAHVFYQDCRVWQAEEVNVNGKWQRYYGVVGPHEIEQVPAADIEFPIDYGWSSLTGGVDCLLQPPGVISNEEFVAELAAKTPLIVHLSLRNRLGVPLQIPTQIAIKQADGTLAIRPGVSVTLARLPGEGEAPIPKEVPLSLKPLAKLSADLIGQRKSVETCESFESCAIDLRDCFNISEVGKYRVQFKFAIESGVGEGSTWYWTDFELK